MKLETFPSTKHCHEMSWIIIDASRNHEWSPEPPLPQKHRRCRPVGFSLHGRVWSLLMELADCSKTRLLQKGMMCIGKTGVWCWSLRDMAKMKKKPLDATQNQLNTNLGGMFQAIKHQNSDFQPFAAIYDQSSVFLNSEMFWFELHDLQP